MGINAELILPEFQNRPIAKILLNFNCSICGELIIDAIALKCQHIFCQLCLTGWIESQGDQSNVPCPDCRNMFDPASGMEESRVTRNVLSVVEFKCTNHLCEEKVNYENLILHSEVCLYGCITCSFCDKEIERRDLDSHKLGCFEYVKYQKSEFEVENNALRIENGSQKIEICSLKAEISALKTRIDDSQETGFSSKSELLI